jgi:hypothetical protein
MLTSFYNKCVLSKIPGSRMPVKVTHETADQSAMRQQWVFFFALALVALAIVVSSLILKPDHASSCTTVRFRAGSTQTCRP